MHPVFQERVLDAPDVCRNCYRLVREKRLKPEWRRSDVSVKEADYSRRRQTTEVAYGPAERTLINCVTYDFTTDRTAVVLLRPPDERLSTGGGSRR